MALTINHQTNDISATSGSMTIDGSAVGGGGADLYAANESSPSAQPSATGTNAIAIGDSAVSSNTNSMALANSLASGVDSFAAAIANNASYGATGANSIAMGYQAKATGDDSIAIGEGSRAFGTYRPLAVGFNAYASQSYSTAIGPSASATESNATALGSGAAASGSYSIAIGDATADAYYSVAIGKDADTNGIRGKYAFACGDFSTSGDAQGGQYILRADVTDTTVTTLTTNNSTASATNQIVAAADTAIAFDGLVTVLQNGAQGWSAFKIQGLLVNDGGGPTYVAGSSVTAITNNSNFTLALSADNTNKALSIKFTGYSNYTIRVVANVRTSEVTYA